MSRVRYILAGIEYDVYLENDEFEIFAEVGGDEE